jgi:hypothetical protein
VNIEECEGYKRLRAAVERDIELKYRSREAEEDHFSWVIERARHYAEKTGLEASDILDAWEKDRDYWHLSYYQDAKQPEIKANNVRAFETLDDFRNSSDGKGFRCPACGVISSDPVTCRVCGWKAYGLLGTLGKGAFVYIKETLRGYSIFIPVAWFENEKEKQ